MKILLIQLKQIGDVLISTCLFENIKKRYPEAKIDYMVYEHTSKLIEGNPHLNKIIILNKKEQQNLLFLITNKLLKLRAEKYDVIIDLLHTPHTAIMTWIINGKKRITVEKDKFLNKLIYNIRIKRPQNMTSIDNRNYLLKGIDENWDNFEKNIRIYLKNEEKQILKNRMIEKGVDFSKPIFAFGVNSRRDYKIWPKEYFVEVINYFIKKYNVNVILHNSPEERKYAEEIKNMIDKKENVFENIDTYNIRELATLFSNIDIYIGNEGGPRHIAEAVGKPTFTIAYLKLNKKFWIPNEGRYHRIIELKDVYNMSDIEYEKYRISKKNEDSLKERYNLKPDLVINKIEKMILDLKIVKK
ncbi:MAG: glycosyl transferase family 9 [Fusobacteriales bacterium]|jgi:heptosyltransferase-2|nr:glycosyl transferase family 9 [Fusobacteriales bacterium]